MTPRRDPIICACLRVRESEIRRAVRNHRIACVEDITRFTEAGDGCTACHAELERVLEEERAAEPPEPKPGGERAYLSSDPSCSDK